MFKTFCLSLSGLKTAPAANTLVFAQNQPEDTKTLAVQQEMTGLTDSISIRLSSIFQSSKVQILQNIDETEQKIRSLDESIRLRENRSGCTHGN